MKTARRAFLTTAALGVAGLAAAPAAAADKPAEDVSATEDLMREHGVLRRILLVYENALRRIQIVPGVAMVPIFRKSATLVRKFVEDYHEKLEENFIFPRFEKRREMLPLVATLRKQHEAGRKLTDRVIEATDPSRLAALPRDVAFIDANPKFVPACRQFLRMYRPHAAREDTVLFPALHRILTAAEMDKLGDQFEDEENRLFGQEGFERTVQQVADIEKQLGILDLDQFTPKL
ncbi:MAG: hemerythrin domain-containing protein [Thermoguttaceae bacterium]